MKKIFALILICSVLIVCFTACSKKEGIQTKSPRPSAPVDNATEDHATENTYTEDEPPVDDESTSIDAPSDEDETTVNDEPTGTDEEPSIDEPHLCNFGPWDAAEDATADQNGYIRWIRSCDCGKTQTRIGPIWTEPVFPRR